LPAPIGGVKSAPLPNLPLKDIAFYEAQGLGVFAPRGWYCREQYGSSGGTLLVTPTPPDSDFPLRDIRGHVVERTSYYGGTSGRFAVARYSSRLFPGKAMKVVKEARSEGWLESSDTVSRDTVTKLSDVLVEFTTPANAAGLGTEYLRPSGDAVRGAAFLDEIDKEWPNLDLVRFRLGAGMRQLETVLLQLNEHCMRQPC